MLLKSVMFIIAIVVAVSAMTRQHDHMPTTGVTITAVCPNEDDLWEHAELCTIDVQPNR